MARRRFLHPAPAERRDNVWAYDFVEERTHNGRKFRTLNIIDEFTHECLAIGVARKLKSHDVIDVLSDLFILRGVPTHIRSDSGPEFIATAVQKWISAVDSHMAISRPVHLGEKAMLKASTPAFGTSCSMARSSTHSEKPRSSSRPGEATKRDPAPCLTRVSAASPGRGNANLRRLAGCAAPTCFAGQATRGAPGCAVLTFIADHPMGADQSRDLMSPDWRSYPNGCVGLPRYETGVISVHRL